MSQQTLGPRLRRCWPVNDWPQADQRLWTNAIAPVTHFADEDGALSQARPTSLTKYIKGYGRWLAVLANIDPSALALTPLDRFSKSRLQAYLDHLRACGNSDGTCINRIEELAVCLRAFDPDFDTHWIRRAASILRSTAKPVRSKAHLRTSEELINLGFDVMRTAIDPTDHKHALAFRDGLLIAFLALHPIRRRNLADFICERNLIRQGAGFLIVFKPSETKTHEWIEVPLAEALIEPMNDYLTRWRPLLVTRQGRWADAINDAVWVSVDGSPLSEDGLAGRIKHWTRQKFGHAINPHLFRDAAATTLAINDPSHVRVAASLLGHRSLTTTEKHYIQASGLQAQQSLITVLNEIRHGH